MTKPERLSPIILFASISRFLLVLFEGFRDHRKNYG
jgi:hypothetical protein